MGFGVQLLKHVADEHIVLDSQQLRHPLRNPDLQHQGCAMLISQVQIARRVRHVDIAGADRTQGAAELQFCQAPDKRCLAIRGQAATAPS